MTPAPADLSHVLRKHGYERNMVLPEALRRRMAAELTITPAQLDGHLQALQDAERETPLTQKAEVKPVEVIDKSLSRRERVLKACEAIGVQLCDEFTEGDKSLFTEALGVKRKAAMQYLKDTRAECTSVPPAGWEQNTTVTAETHQSGDPEACVAATGSSAATLTTACTEHPTHTATRCDGCAKETPCLRCKTNAADNCRPCINAETERKLKETETRIRTETAAQYEAHLSRSLDAAREPAIQANRELADRNMALALKLEATERELGAEKEAAALLRVSLNATRAISDEKRRWVEAVTDVHTVLDNAGVTAGATPAERVQALARQRDDSITAHRKALEGIGYAHQNLDEVQENHAGDSVATRCFKLAETYNELIAAHENLMRENAALKEQVQVREDAVDALMPDYDTSEKLAIPYGLVNALATRTTADHLRREEPARPELTDDARDFAAGLFKESGATSLPMGTRSAVLQLAADMAALAASR